MLRRRKSLYTTFFLLATVGLAITYMTLDVRDDQQPLGRRSAQHPTQADLDRPTVGSVTLLDTVGRHSAPHDTQAVDTVETTLCTHRFTQTVVYNRLPKSGSRTVNKVIKKLWKTTHKFDLHHSLIFHQTAVNSTEIHKIADLLFTNRTTNRPLVFDRHFYFVNFSEYGYPMPAYINTFRDPLQRLISDYYFRRLKSNVSKDKFSQEEQNRTFESCVSAGISDCVGEGATNILVNWFCGQHTLCRRASVAALQQAKRNVLQRYSLVAPTDDLEWFISALEKVFPHIFLGALDIYKRNYTEGINLSHTLPQYVLPPSHVQEFVKSRYLSLEYEMFDFLTNRYRALKGFLSSMDCAVGYHQR